MIADSFGAYVAKTTHDHGVMTSGRVVVVGAGILGAAVAARLAEAGLRVTLLDQDQPGCATSRWSFAWINSNDKAPRPYHDLNHAGIRAWAELAPDLDGDAWYRPSGHVELAASRAELEARVQRLTDWGYPARLVDAAEAAALEPALRVPPDVAAAFFPGEGYLLTEPLIARLVARAQTHGARIRTGEPGRVTGLDTSPGAPPRVRTAAGAVLEADEVICCAGRWTPALAALSGTAAAPPLVPWETSGSTAPGLVVRVSPVAPPGPVRVVHTPDLALRPHPGGLLHLEAEDAAAAVDLHTPEPELRRWADELLRRARRTVRGLDDARVVELKVCVRPLPADGQSIVGRLPGAPGIYVAVTHSGVTLAAHLSRLITADLTTGTPPTLLTPYTPARFIPGNKSARPDGSPSARRLLDLDQVAVGVHAEEPAAAPRRPAGLGEDRARLRDREVSHATAPPGPRHSAPPGAAARAP
jgi:glycine/D-amino acid oxidase-like deaminating enzyme